MVHAGSSDLIGTSHTGGAISGNETRTPTGLVGHACRARRLVETSIRRSEGGGDSGMGGAGKGKGGMYRVMLVCPGT